MVRTFSTNLSLKSNDRLIGLSVNAIIFLAPISAFDQVLAEVRDHGRRFGLRR